MLFGDAPLTGLFITIEGIEGSGKSSQVQRLVNRLNRLNIPTVVSREPGGTKLCQGIRSLLLEQNNYDEVWTPKAELMLFYADRIQHISQFITPMLESGNVVILDRFDDSTRAYQGARGIEDSMMDQMTNLVLGSLRPTITLLLDIDPTISLTRAANRNKIENNFSETRFDEEDLRFHHLVRNRFLEIAQKDTKRIFIISAIEPPDKVEEMIWTRVSSLMQGIGYRVN